MGLLDLISARNPGEARQTLADLVRGPQNRLRGLLDSPVNFLTDALNDVVPTGQQAAEQLQRYQLPMSQDYAMGPSGYDNKLKDMALAGLTVYHGSPHKFDKFDMNKIGTGEGAQAYGHGLYFAEAPEVGKEYARTLSQLRDKVVINGKEFDNTNIQAVANELGISPQAAYKAIGNIGRKDRFEAFREQAARSKQAWERETVPQWDEAISVRDKINQVSGNLYKVDLPDEHIAKMLDWDKPLSQQSTEVQKLAFKNAKKMKKEVAAYQNPINGEFTPNNIYDLSGADLVKVLGKGGPAENQLKSIGIPGIRYLDGGSRGTGSGTSNYVVFDDSLLKILERNGMPVP